MLEEEYPPEWDQEYGEAMADNMSLLAFSDLFQDQWRDERLRIAANRNEEGSLGELLRKHLFLDRQNPMLPFSVNDEIVVLLDPAVIPTLQNRNSNLNLFPQGVSFLRPGIPSLLTENALCSDDRDSCSKGRQDPGDRRL